MDTIELLRSIRSHSNQPLTRQWLTSILKNHNEPGLKLNELLSAGLLETVRDGLFLPTKKLSPFRPEPFLLANHLFGPSYVSFDSALSFYGLIPERVYEVTSATTKPVRRFDNSAGRFSFTRLPLPYYSFGIRHLAVGDEQYILIASPEKALVDKVIITAGIRLRSTKSAAEFLFENLRIDEDSLQGFDIEMISTWLTHSPKRESVFSIMKLVETLR